MSKKGTSYGAAKPGQGNLTTSGGGKRKRSPKGRAMSSKAHCPKPLTTSSGGKKPSVSRKPVKGGKKRPK